MYMSHKSIGRILFTLAPLLHDIVLLFISVTTDRTGTLPFMSVLAGCNYDISGERRKSGEIVCPHSESL